MFAFRIYGLLLVLAVLSACSPVVHRPNMVNTPLFKAENEFQAAVAAGGAGNEIHLAYSITDHWAVIAGGAYGKRDSIRDQTNAFQNIFVHAAGGYYTELKDDLIFETFAGYGWGDSFMFSNEFTGSNLKIDNNYQQVYLQPSIGMIKGNIDFSGTLRYSLLNYHSIRDGAGINYGRTNWDHFVDPAITFRFGYNQFKFISQVGMTIPVYKQASSRYDYQGFIFGLGFHINLAQRYRDEY